MLRTYRRAARWYGEAESECQPGYLAAIRAPCPKKMAAKQAVARKSNRKWMSPGSQEFSANLKGDKIHLKQNSSDTYRIWWMPVLMKGRLHIEVFNAEFPGETVPGAQIAAEKLRPILNLRFKWWQSKPD